jgi:hypothetical protein
MTQPHASQPGAVPAVSPVQTAARGKRRLRWRTRFVIVAVSCLMGLGLAEAALRVANISYGDLYTPDPHCGSRLRPGYAGWFTKEGRAFIRINSQGLRDREHFLAKAPGVLRIAVLGDSYAEALQVPWEDTFWHVLEEKLQSCEALGSRQVEVINFGVSGYGTAQELQMLRNYVWQYDPDVVLLLFYPGNDVRNNSQELEPEKARPFFSEHDGDLVLDNSFLEHPTYVAAQRYYASWRCHEVSHSRLLQIAREVWRSARTPRAAAAPAVGSEAGLDDETYRPPSSAPWLAAWDISEQLIVVMAGECREHSADFWVALATRGIEVNPDHDVRRRFRERVGQNGAISYPEQRLMALGERQGFHVVPLAAPLLKFAMENDIHVHGFSNALLGQGHWNQHGHRIAGLTIAEQMCARLPEWLATHP